MKVVNTWVFTYEQFKDIECLADTVMEIDMNKRPRDGWDTVWLTINDWPRFHMIKVYEVIDIETNAELLEGNTFYVERPYSSYRHARGGTTYPKKLIKVIPERIEKLKSILL